jgi:hypothetical protein
LEQWRGRAGKATRSSEIGILRMVFIPSTVP